MIYTTSTKSGKIVVTAAAVGVPTINIFVTATADPGSSIGVVSGNGQTAVHSVALPKPLVAKVTDQYGNLVTGAIVTFSDGDKGGTFSGNPVTTTKTGLASVTYTTPATAGSVTVSATATGVTTPANFTVTVQ